ncbi:hypothetical protein [Clostridium beijerinckii]|nr:hypothetical protein [Clostridium beijerinckii]
MNFNEKAVIGSENPVTAFSTFLAILGVLDSEKKKLTFGAK